jgi:hypothetical protein
MPHIEIRKTDGINIVIGFGSPGIDPVATKKRVAEELQKSTEWKAAELLRERIAENVGNLLKNRAQLTTQLKISSSRQTKHAISKKTALRDRYEETNAKIEEYRQQVGDAMAKVAERGKQLFDECAVLLQGPGYREVDQATHQAMQDKHRALGPSQLLTADGSIVDDLRRTDYIYKIDGRWVSGRITKLGEVIPEGGKPVNQLTDDDRRGIMDQGKRDMIADLTPDEREKMLKQDLDAAALSAAQLVTAYELQRREDPRGDARAWLDVEESKIKEIYNVA